MGYSSHEKLTRYTSGYTQFGRNAEAIARLKQIVENKRAVIWVAGFGGRTVPQQTDENAPFKPTEPVEAALAAWLAGADFVLHAIDNHPDAIKLLEKYLQDEYLPIYQEMQTPDELLFQPAIYAKDVLGIEPTKNHLKIPEKVIPRIHVHGPDKNGDLLKILPTDRPNVITCFNLAYHLNPKVQRRLADNFAQALLPGARILTDNKNNPFTKRLKRHLGIPLFFKPSLARYLEFVKKE